MDIQEGWKDDVTGRIAVKAIDYANSSLNGDARAYLFTPEKELMGEDPWLLVDGVDIATNGETVEIWGVAEWSKTVNLDFLIFVSPAHFNELRKEQLRPIMTDEFLATLAEAAKVCGWEVDHAETAQFVAWCYGAAGKEPPVLQPYPY